MNLVIDIGNTRSKIAVVGNGEILEIFRCENITSSYIDDILSKYPKVKRAILSSVCGNNLEIEEFLKNKLDYFLKMSHSVPVPIINCYSTPNTLGMDRIIGAVGAVDKFPNQEILIFDMGSAITIDRITSEGEYLGGNISPGMAMRFKALNILTNKLPLCKIDEKISLIGKTTEEAIVNGVVNGIIYEIEGYICQFKRNNDKIVIIFTGGDANYFVFKVKNAIFADCDLLLKGLNKVLEYNYEENEGK